MNETEGCICPPQFDLLVGPKAQGLYSLKFHYCMNRIPGVQLPYSFTVIFCCSFARFRSAESKHVTGRVEPQVEVTEKNPGGFLSAAEIPLSRLYLYMAGVFFTAAIVWVHILMKHRCLSTQTQHDDVSGYHLFFSPDVVVRLFAVFCVLYLRNLVDLTLYNE